MTKDERRRWGSFALATTLSVAAYHLSVFGGFFLLPLQWVRQRQGESSFWVAAVLASVGIGVVEAVVKSLMHSPWSLLDAAVIGLPLLLIAGWVVIVALERLGWRFLYRLLTVTAVTGLILFPLIASLLRQEAVVQVVQRSFDELWTLVLQTPGLQSAGLVGQLNKAEFFDFLKQAFLGSFLSVFFLFWAFNGWLSRVFVPVAERRTLKDFFVPSQGAWILLGLWGLVLVKFLLALKGIAWKWGDLEYVVANVAFIVLVVHVAAGWGILQVLMDQWKIPRLGQGAARILMIVLLVTSVAGTWLVLGGLAALAVLELWVNFRKRTQGVEI